MLEFNGTLLVIAISFIIFVILENFIFYRPMKKILKDRADYIEKNETEANNNISAAKSLEEERDEKIATAKGESSQIINDMSYETQQKFDVAVKEAKINSNQKLEEMKNKLEMEKLEVQNALRSEIAIHASKIVSKILKKDVAMVNVNDEIIDKALRGEL